MKEIKQVEKLCDFCKTHFLRVHHSQKFCSIECKVKHRTVSKPQQALFNELSFLCPYNDFQLEKFVKCKDSGYHADIISESKKIIIELHGDYWHCNPNKYESDFFHHKKKKTAKEIWEFDNLRKKQLEELGYNVFVVWASDYSKTQNKVLDDLKNNVLGYK